MKKITFLLFVFFLSSCSPDDSPRLGNSGNNNQDDIAFHENFGSQIQTNFIGRIVNTQGSGLGGVNITIGNSVTTTDANGIFKLNSVTVYERFAYVKAFRDDYLLGSRTIVPNASSTNSIEITLLRRNTVEYVSAGIPEQVDFNGVSVHFPGQFITSNGDIITSGEVGVSIHYLKPNEVETYNQMPGSLFGQNLDNDPRALETYGMVAINLFDSSGELINIDENSPATIEFPVDVDQASIAPESINLWYFDEEQGYWKEEGVAHIVGDKYIAEVTHFSWWNCDLPIRYINACFALETETGNLPNNYVEIIRNETNQIIFSGYTNYEGEECGLFPADETITLKVYGELDCQDEVIYQNNIGPFSIDTSFTVNVPITNFEQTTITATVNKCNGELLENGYALIYNVNEQNIISNATSFPISNGQLNYSLNYCVADQLEMIIYDLDDNTNSDTITLSLQAGSTDLGFLQTCEQTGGIYYGNITLSSQQEIDNFGLLGYTSVIGRLYINGYESDITDLSGLSNLVEVSGRFSIGNCDQLQTLEGLDVLTNAIEIQISNNNLLTNLIGLNNIASELYFFEIDYNDNLIDFTGLEHITYIENLHVQNNDGLTSFDGLSSLEDLNVLTLHGSPNLNSLVELDNITSLWRLGVTRFDNTGVLNQLSNLSTIDNFYLFNSNIGEVEIFNNITTMTSIYMSSTEAFTDLNMFNNLTSVDEIVIQDMPNLISLEGLNNLNSVEQFLIGGHYNILDEFISFPNSSLIDYCALNNLVSNGTYEEIRIDEGNAYSPTAQDIIDGNCSL